MSYDDWVTVSGFGGRYLLNNLGVLRVIDREIITPSGGKGVIKGKVLGYQISNKGYYLYTVVGNKTLSMHRLIAAYFIPNPENKLCVNHINGIRTDNRIENLEWVDYRENISHSLLKRKKASKYIGVVWDNPRKKWKAVLKHNKKLLLSKRFNTEYEAHLAYVNKLKEINLTNKYAK